MAPNCAAKQETRPARALFPKDIQFPDPRISRLEQRISMTGPAQRSRIFYSGSRAVDPATRPLPGRSRPLLRHQPCPQVFRDGLRRMPLRKARLANSISQRERSTPTHGGTRDSPSHGFQTFHFNGAALALHKVLLAVERIYCVQFPVEKSMKNEFPFRTGATRAGFGCGQADHRNAHPVVPDGQLAPALTMTLPFMFGWIEHK
jgi:hypothetical protein